VQSSRRDKCKSDNHLLLRPQTGSRVCDLHTQYLRPLKDRCAVAAADIVRDLRGEAFVVHQEKIDLSCVADKELLQPVGQKMPGLLVAPVTNLGHRKLTLEPAPHPVVNTLGFPPCLLHALVPVRLVALEGFRALLDDGDLDHVGLKARVNAEFRTI